MFMIVLILFYNPVTNYLIHKCLSNPSTLIDIEELYKNKFMTKSKASDDKGNSVVIYTGYLGDGGILWTCRTLFQTGR